MSVNNNRLADLVNQITKMLFSHEYSRLEKQVISLVKENASLGGPIDGFYFNGKLFSDLDPRLRAKGTKGNYSLSMVPALELYIQDEKTVNFERDRVKQALAMVLKDCKSYQDIRNALPNCLKDHLDCIRMLDRTDEEAFTLKNNPRAYAQYMKIRDKIVFYTTAKMLY